MMALSVACHERNPVAKRRATHCLDPDDLSGHVERVRILGIDCQGGTVREYAHVRCLTGDQANAE
jgi:hypothetical protein